MPATPVQQAFAADWPAFQAKIIANEPGGIIGRAINAHMDDLKQATFEVYSVAYYRGQSQPKPTPKPSKK